MFTTVCGKASLKRGTATEDVNEVSRSLNFMNAKSNDVGYVPYVIVLVVPRYLLKRGLFICPGNSTALDYVATSIAIHAVELLNGYGVVDSRLEDWTGDAIAEVLGNPEEFGDSNRRYLATWTFSYICRVARCPKLTCGSGCNPDNSDKRQRRLQSTAKSAIAMRQGKFESGVEAAVLADLQANCGTVKWFSFRYVGNDLS